MKVAGGLACPTDLLTGLHTTVDAPGPGELKPHSRSEMLGREHLLQDLDEGLREEKKEDFICPSSKTMAHPLICSLWRGGWGVVVVLVSVTSCCVANHPKTDGCEQQNYLLSLALSVGWAVFTWAMPCGLI